MTPRHSSVRTMPRRRLLVVAAALSVGVALPATALPPGGAVTRPNGAKVTLDRTVVKQGLRIKVTGTNWKSQASRINGGRKVVTVKLDDSHILAVFPIKNKKFSGWVTIPRQVKPGNHTLRFLASKPATSVKSKVFRVTKR